MKKQKKEKFAPIHRDDVKIYASRWLKKNPLGGTCYVELSVADINSLIQRNNLSESNGFVRIYFGVNNDGRETCVLVAAKSAKNGTIEESSSKVNFGENFGTLCPPYNIQSDPNSLASEIISELLNIPRPPAAKKTVTKQKKKI